MLLQKLLSKFVRWWPLIGGVLAFLVGRLLAQFPEFTETVYRNTVFNSYRWIWDTTLGWIPFPVMLLVLLFYFVYAFVLWRRRWLFNYTPWFRLPLNFLGGLVLWFYLAWGFNYSAPGLVDKLNIDRPSRVNWDDLKTRATQEALDARAQFDTLRLQETEISAAEELAIHNAVRSFLRDAEVATPGRVRVRVISLNGWMRRIGISGIYSPFSGECHVDGSYPLLQQWFTMAHEIAHGYGITDEGECNFVAFMALQSSSDEAFVYSAWFSLLLELVPRNEIESLPTALRGDRLMLRANAEKYPPLIPRLAEKTNHLYLKSQGVEGGIDSYSRWPQLVYALVEESISP
jgi:hypothetical protein